MLIPTRSQIKKFGGINIVKKVLNKTKGKCWYCGIVLLPTKNKTTLEYQNKMLSFDHLNPKSKEGKNTYYNLVPACCSCNNKKANGGINFLRTKLLFKKNNWPEFSLTLYEFLCSKGIELHNITLYDLNSDKYEKYTFFFEQNNLVVSEDKNGDRQSGL